MRGKASILIAGLLALLALAGATVAAAAPPPAAGLDQGFGQEGRAYVPFPGSQAEPHDREAGLAAAVGPDGSLVLATGDTIKRLTPDGQVDEAFGQDGAVKVTAPSGDSFRVEALAIDSQGRIVAAGTSFHDSEKRPPSSIYGFESWEQIPTAARIIRLLPDGRLDPEFGEGGVVETVFGLPAPPPEEGASGLSKAEVTVTGVAIDAGDSIVLTGGSLTGRAYPCAGGVRSLLQSRLTYAAYVARLTVDGKPDTTFGGGDGIFGGQNVSENPLHSGTATEPAIGPDGSIIYGSGYARCTSDPPAIPGLAWLTPAGEPGPGFSRKKGATGAFWRPTPGPDGSITSVGLERWAERQPIRMRVFRLGADGRPDPNFGEKGTTRVTLRGPAQAFSATVAVDSQERVLLADSQTARGAWRGFGLFRLRPDGTVERNFAPGGRIGVDAPHLDGPARLLLDPQGRALLLAEYRGEGGEGLVVARLVFSR